LYSDTVTVKVIAMDRNIFDYARKSYLSTMTGVDLDLVEGSHGVFGSICVDSVDVVLE